MQARSRKLRLAASSGGEKVRVLVDEHQIASERNITWDGKNDRDETVASGIFLYRLEAGSFTKTAKMTLLK